MTKLNQIIAIEKGIKARDHSEISELYKAIQKPELFNGFSKTYQKKDDEGEDLPAEKKRVQFVATEVLRSVERTKSELMNVTARKDWTNCDAIADVVVEGVTVLAGAPVTFLLFMEKQLTDLRTFASTIPVLDESENWIKDVNSGLYKSDESKTHRTKKMQKSLVLIQPTIEHPGQAQLITEDIIAGFWTSVKQSGAMPKPERQALVERIDKLIKAVKEARESANSIDQNKNVPDVGAKVFGFLLGETV